VRSDALLPCALSRFIFTVTSEYKASPVFTPVFPECSAFADYVTNTRARIAE